MRRRKVLAVSNSKAIHGIEIMNSGRVLEIHKLINLV